MRDGLTGTGRSGSATGRVVGQRRESPPLVRVGAATPAVRQPGEFGPRRGASRRSAVRIVTTRAQLGDQPGQVRRRAVRSASGALVLDGSSSSRKRDGCSSSPTRR